MAAQRDTRHLSDEQVGAWLMRSARDFILHDPVFAREWDNTHPLFFRGKVTQVKPSGDAVKIRRSAAQHDDAFWYPVYASFYVPARGDDALLAYTNGRNAAVVAVRGAGRPNQWSVASSGGALQKLDSRGLAIALHGDDHRAVHLQPDGRRVAAHTTPTGTHTIAGDHQMLFPATQLNAVSGAVVKGGYHKKTHNAATGTYEHRVNKGTGKGEQVVRTHSPSTHTHLTQGKAGAGSGGSWTMVYETLTHPDGHQWGDDGSGQDQSGLPLTPVLKDPTDAPQLTALAGSAGAGLAAGSYQLAYSFGNAGGETLLSPLAPIAVDAGGQINVPAYGTLPNGAAHITYWMSTAPDGTTLAQLAQNSGGAVAISSLPTGTTTLPAANQTQQVADPTVAPGLLQVGGVADGGSGFGLLLEWPGAPASGPQTVPPGRYRVAYAWQMASGATTKISPPATLTITPGCTSIQVTGVPALPSGVTAVVYYMTPLQTQNQLLSLRWAGSHSSNASVQLAAPGGGATSWPSANGTAIINPAAPLVLTQSPVIGTPGGLGAGGYNACYALYTGAGGSGASSASSAVASLTLTANQALQLGPVDLPANAGSVSYYVQPPGGHYTFAGSTNDGSALTITSLSGAGSDQNPSSNTTTPYLKGTLGEKHANGHWVRKYDGKNHQLLSLGQPHVKLCAAKHAVHYDASTPTPKVTHVAHASGDHHHTGDHYHGYTAKSTGLSGSISEANCIINLAGPYIRHTRNDTCDNAHETYIHDGASQKIIRSHGPIKGQTIHDAFGAVQHHQAVSSVGSVKAGTKHHTGDHVHSVQAGITVNCDGSVTLGGAYFRKWMDAACDTGHVVAVNKGDGQGERRLSTHGPSKGHLVHDGSTAANVAHLHHPAGHKVHKGDHYHSVQGAITPDCVGGFTLGGAYFRKTMDTGCDLQHIHFVNRGDGQGERVLSTHGSTRGYSVFDGSTAAHLVHSLHPSGQKSHTGDHVHNAATISVDCSGNITLGGNYQRKTVESDGSGGYQYAHYHTTIKVRHHHPTSGSHGFYLNGNKHVEHAASGNGGKTRHKQHGGSGFHESGDDGTGRHSAVHASGSKIWDHDGTVHRRYGGAFGQIIAQHDGVTLTDYANNGQVSRLHSTSSHALYHLNQLALSHDGTNLIHYGPDGAERNRFTNVGLSGKVQMQRGYSSPYEVGEDGTGNMHLQTYGGKHTLHVNGTAQAHVLDSSAHQFPQSNVRINNPDGSRLDLLAGSGGAIKSNSHSVTVSGYGVGIILPTGSGGFGCGFPGTGNYNKLLFKLMSHEVWYGSNPGHYRHAGTSAARNNGFGADAVGSPGGNVAGWSAVDTFADDGVQIYGGTYSGGAFAGTATCLIAEVND